MNFEESLEKLNEIVRQLQDGKLSLEESLDKYKEGIDLSEICRKKLDEAKLFVETVNVKENDND